MKTQIFIDTAHGGMIFSLAYFAAFLTAAGMMMYHGARKGYPPGKWLLILMSGVVFFIAGDKVINYTPHQWMTVLTDFRFPPVTEKNSFGGIPGLFAGIFLAKRLLRFKQPVLDSLAIALPVALAVSRVGCLFAGCCYGSPTELLSGIAYGPESAAYQAHLAEGLISAHAHTSLMVHPVQFYQVAGSLLVAFLVYRSWAFWKSPGSPFLFSVLMYGFMRFFMEFLVDPSAGIAAGKVFGQLNLVQLLILVAFLPLTAVLVIREVLPVKKQPEPYREKTDEFRRIILMVALSLVVYCGRNWFDLIELSMMLIFLIPLWTMTLVSVYRHHTLAGTRWLMPVLLIGCLGLMSQKNLPTGSKETQSKFMEVGLTGMMGKYTEELQRVMISTDCNGHKEYYYQNITDQTVPMYQGGLNVSYNQWKGKFNKIKVGAQVFYGNENPPKDDYSGGSTVSVGISPYITCDWKNVGFQTGFSLGLMKIPVGKPESWLSNDEVISLGHSRPVIFPALALRLGPADIFYAEAAFPGLFPYAAPFPQFRAGFGSGFGKTNGTAASVGYAGNSFYTRLVLPIKNTWVVEATYADNFSTHDKVQRVLALGVSYRLPMNKTTEK